MRTLSGTVLPAIAGLRPLRHHDPSATVTISVMLQGRDPEGQARFMREMEDPKSPNFRKTLTPDEAHARFSPTDESIAAVKAWGARHGLSFVDVQAGNSSVTLQAPAGSVERALSITFNDYALSSGSASSPSGQGAMANDRDPTIPASLPVTAILGLNDARAADPRH